MTRPDQSFYLAHFTKNGKKFAPSMDPHTDIDEMSAFERLISILKCKKIQAHKLPWTNRSAVCFTECPWGSLLRHAKSYSPYGIGFTKKLVYSRNGNPVIYRLYHRMRPTLLKIKNRSMENQWITPTRESGVLRKTSPFSIVIYHLWF